MDVAAGTDVDDRDVGELIGATGTPDCAADDDDDDDDDDDLVEEELAEDFEELVLEELEPEEVWVDEVVPRLPLVVFPAPGGDLVDPFEDDDSFEDAMDDCWDEVEVAGLSGPAERVEVDEDD